jgi:hypothetical protein
MDNNHKKIVLKTLFFAALLGFFYLATAFVLSRTIVKGRRLMAYVNPMSVRLGGQEHKMTREFNGNEKYDVFVLGSSHAYRGYDPRVFKLYGYELFNAGSSAQHPLISAVLLSNMAGQLEHKPLVIIDVYDWILEMDGDESIGRVMLNSADIGMACEIFCAKPNIVAFNTLVARWLLPDDFIEVEAKDYVGNGYCMRTDSLDEVLPPLKETFKMDDRAKGGIVDMVAWLKENHCPFVFVSHPMPPRQGRETYHEFAVKELESIVGTEQLVYLDFNNFDFGPQWRAYFGDAAHLNQAGVDLFNDMLIDSLESRGMLRKASM